MKARTSLQRHGDHCLTRNRTRFDETDIFIYAFIDASGSVIYVGRTYDPGTRIGAHRCGAAWWSEQLTFAVVDIVRGWSVAVEAEAAAIRALCPEANIQHNRNVA